jgi:hypothetical protein
MTRRYDQVQLVEAGINDGSRLRAHGQQAPAVMAGVESARPD